MAGQLGHYSSAQTILVVGDGDLSFSLALADAFGSGENLVATSLDSYDALTSKYGQAESNVTELERLGATVLHGVDAKTMKLHAYLKMKRFDRIVFNFPHAGFKGHETQLHMINLHKELVRLFFCNASHLLRPDGEIHVSHKTGQPYDRWDIEQLASDFSLVRFEMVDFRKEEYPGYNQKKGYGEKCDEEFPLRNGCTSKFRVEREEAEERAQKDAFSTAAQREGEKKMITLKSSDGEEFEVEEAVAMESQTIRHMIEDDCADNGIPLHNINSKILSKVIEYCNKHIHTAEDLKNWDADLVKVDQATLFDLILAANDLKIKGLLDLTCQTVADMIKGKTPEEIRKTFNKNNEFTPEEEEEIRRENQWAFE